MITEIWVDGSFVDGVPSWAILVKQDGQEVHKANGPLLEKSLIQYRQISGELEAAKQAFMWCQLHSINKVIIHYDYEGIYCWAVGCWNARNPVTAKYANFASNAIKKIDVQWSKIKAHTGEEGNEEVDRMAKISSSISIRETSKGIILTYKAKSYEIDLNNLIIKKL